jgi:hypothetical protein
MDEDAILNKIADIQFEFLENQYNKFKEHEKKAKKLAQTSTAALKLSNSKTDDEKKLSFQEQYDRDYALLDDRQKKFLEDSDIKNEMFLNVIKYKRRKAMKVKFKTTNFRFFLHLISIKLKELCDNINDTTMDKEPRNSFLTKKQSRLSLVSSTAIQIKNNSKRGTFFCSLIYHYWFLNCITNI